MEKSLDILEFYTQDLVLALYVNLVITSWKDFISSLII